MKRFEWFWQADDGTRLYAQSWEPDAEVTGVICLVHGHGEHSGRYADLAAVLGADGYATMSFDHRGHGKSPGKRGHVPSYDAVMDDIGRLLDEAARRYSGKTRFLYGQSMGGNLALNYALRRHPSIAGVIAASPWLRLAFAPPPWKVAVGRAMDRIWPAFTQPSGLETKAISRDPTVVRAYEDDPLNHDLITARLFNGCYDAGLWALDHAAEFPLPLLLMHGSADRITSTEASRAFAANAPGCTFRLWDGCYHETHNEPERQEVLTFLLEWLRRTVRGHGLDS